MFDQDRKNIKALDEQIMTTIGKMGEIGLSPDTLDVMQKQLTVLIDYRTKMYGTTKEHWIAVPVIKGVFGLAGILLVLYYEKLDVITSKAFNMGTRMTGD